MHKALQKLASLTNKPKRIIGLMSGTSLDGLDIVLCNIEGAGLQTTITVEKFSSVAYDAQFLSQLRPLFANANAPLSAITLLNSVVARQQADIILEVLKEWQIDSSEIDVLASHGQTIYHAPCSYSQHHQSQKHSATLQIGDGDHLAYLTQILTVSDFRQKHVAANGEGAPLVPYADYLLFSSSKEARILLNIGGIANFSYLPINKGNICFDSVVSADTGPGNTLMDALVQQAINHPKPYDENAELAAKGNVNTALLEIMLGQTESMQSSTTQSQKSTGQEVYNLSFIKKALAMLNKDNVDSPELGTDKTNVVGSAEHESTLPKTGQALYDLVATLNMFSASLIAIAFKKANIPLHAKIYVSGGGVHNSVLLKNIKQVLPDMSVKNFADLGIHADAKEAALFAVLANETLFGDYSIFENKQGIPATSLGKISLPY